MRPLTLLAISAALLGGCVDMPAVKRAETCPPCAACPACPGVEPTKPAEKPLQPAEFADLPEWENDDHAAAFEVFRAACPALERKNLWSAACTAARAAGTLDAKAARLWFEERMRPWQLVEPDGKRDGLVTGYYEPVLRGSRERKPPYLTPVFAPPADMVTVELGELYPELKHMRLRGRIEGRKLVPYWSRAEWTRQEPQRAPEAMIWLDDALDFFFMQIQGSGQVVLDDGSRIRMGYADQNGHPYRSIGRWLIDQGELKSEQASMQGIKNWAREHPERVQELMNANPSLVFFRELAADGAGPPGALGVALTPERSIAVDPRHLTLGAPVYLDTTYPDSPRPLRRLMLAQDTGGAIRGVVRADFYWGSGAEAGSRAGRMKQRGRMWVLMPQDYAPK